MDIIYSGQILENSHTLEEVGSRCGERLIVSMEGVGEPEPSNIVRSRIHERCEWNGLGYWRDLVGA